MSRPGLDPVLSLASSMQVGPGTYALLLGSGLSRSAGIPTGWEITLELIRRVAALQDPDNEPPEDPLAWWQDRYGKPPEYSELIAELAPTQAERRTLLERFFRPREDGYGQPGAAHLATAELIKNGYIRVVITTNFDRLLETALTEVGVDPTIISHAAHIAGARPIQHAECTLIKVHGDYQDDTVRNTAQELADYDPAMEELLRRIIDEHGMIISGWSATWDPALRRVFRTVSSRRYATYFTRHSQLTDEAEAVIAHRDATVVDIADADSFFTRLRDLVDSVERLSRPHPLSVATAVETVKRYLQPPKRPIDLTDLLDEEVTRIREATPDVRSTPKGEYLDTLRRLEATTERLRYLLPVIVQHGDADSHQLLARVLTRLLNHPHQQSSRPAPDLNRYPALLVLYTIGIAAQALARQDLLVRVLQNSTWRDELGNEPAIEILMWGHVVRHGRMKELHRPDDQITYHLPVVEWLGEHLREPLRPLLPDDDHYERSYRDFEVVLSALLIDASTDEIDEEAQIRGVAGKYLYERGGLEWDHPTRTPLGRVHAAIVTQGAEWPPISAGAFRGDPGRARRVLEALARYAQDHGYF